MSAQSPNGTSAAVRLILAILFGIKGISNLFPSAAVIADFERFRYPQWFRVVVALAELLGALLILRPRYTGAAVTLLATITTGGMVTLINAGDFRQSLVPMVILCIIAYVSWNHRTRV